jgi:major type 1 subunit fimbrin (pilin)
VNKTVSTSQGKLMKKRILCTTMVASLGLFAANMASAVDSTITVQGRVLAATCSIHGGSAGGGGNFTVKLPDVSTSDFTDGIGSNPNNQLFSIFVGAKSETGCSDGTVVNVHFDSTSPRIDSTTGNLTVDPVAGAATGVQLMISNSDGSKINLATKPDSTKYTIVGHTAEIPLYVGYVSVSSKLTPGPANSSVMYSVSFN